MKNKLKLLKRHKNKKFNILIIGLILVLLIALLTLHYQLVVDNTTSTSLVKQNSQTEAKISYRAIQNIFITNAEHLNSDRSFINNIYGRLKEKDGVWQAIPSGDYVRVTFEKNLTSGNDITIYARSDKNSSIDVFEKNSNESIAKFVTINKENGYKIFLVNLTENQDVFDLKVLGNPIEFDYIVDPFADNSSLVQTVDDCGTLNTTNAVYTMNQSVVSNSTCFTILANNITLDGAGYTINYSATGTLGYGFNVSRYNYTTIKNAIIKEGSSTTNLKYAIFLSTSYNNTIFNNTINTSGSTIGTIPCAWQIAA